MHDIPGAEAEAADVGKLVGVEPVLGAAVTYDRVLHVLRSASRVHIAAHGTVASPDPGEHGLVFRDGDGFRTLTLHELRRATLDHVDLLTLATCRSGHSALLPGGERICLPTALLDAGVRGVVAALWPVADEPSREVMTTLYRRLRRERPAVALARTQAELGPRAVEHWAGLVFYGNE